MRRLLQHWTKIIHNSQFLRRISLEEQKEPKRRTVSFAVDRLPTWSTITSGSLGAMILSKTTPTCSLFFFEMTIFRNSILSGTEFYCLWRKSHMMTSWKDCTNKEYESLKNYRPYWTCTTWRLIRRKLDLIITDWKLWWREVSSKKFEIRILGTELEILRRTPWSRIREQNSVNKEFLEIVGNGKPTGNVWKETIAVSATIWISVEKSPSNPSPNSFMRQSERKSSRTRSPRGRSPSGRMSRWPCKDYLRGTCNNSFCEKWHPPECLYCKTKSGCRFGEKCSFAHRQVDEQPTKRSQKMMTKEQWLCWRRVIGKNLSPMDVTIERGNLWKEVIRNWDKIHLNVDFLMHDNWVAYFRTWRRRSLFSGRALTCRSQSSVWTSQRLLHVIPKFETKIPRSVTFVQVNLMSVAPTLRNLRIVHKKRQSGKSKVPAKQRGSWPKMC